MPRKISMAMTIEPIRRHEKFVTRRFGWWFLKPGDVLDVVEKTMGLKLGEKHKPIIDIWGNPVQIQIVNTRPEPLNAIDHHDVTREGFPGMTPSQFVNMLVKKYNVPGNQICNRIEFTYIIQTKEQAA